MRRIFFALEVSEEGRATLRDAVARLGAHPSAERLRLRWSPEASFHNTLKFVGNVPSETVDALLDDARKMPLPAAQLPSDWLGLDAFPSADRARVLVARASDPSNEVRELAAAFEDMCAAHGIARETRGYQLHVTVARMRFPARVRDLCEAVSLTGAFRLGPIVLYESHLSPHGSTYEPLWKSA